MVQARRWLCWGIKLMVNYDLTKVSPGRVFRGLGLSKKQVEGHMRASLKITAKRIQTHTVREIARIIKLPNKDVKKRVRANYFQSGMAARISYYVKPVNLIRFKARQTRRGVTSRIMSVPSAFIATMPNGRFPIVVKRRGRKRLPIDPVKVELSGVSAGVISKYSGKQAAKWYWKVLRQRANWVRSKQ